MRKHFLAAAALLSSAALPVLAQTAPADVVYVETNSPSGNAILTFSRSASGGLVPLAGSPFAAGGTGVTDPAFGLNVFSNDTPLIANAAHTLLFAVNEGSNSIAVFNIASNGSLSPVSGSPFASGGYEPASLTLVNDVLTVVNKNTDPAQASVEANAQPNYTNFRVAANGALSPIAGSTITATTSPSQAVSIPTSRYNAFRFLGYGDFDGPNQALTFGADFGAGNLQSLQLKRDATFIQNALTTLPPQLYVGRTFGGGPAPALPLGLAVNPNFPLLYVGLVTISDVGVYFFNPQGQLFALNAVPDPAQGADCWLLPNPSGTRLYAVGTGGNTLTTFDIGTDAVNPRVLSVTNLRQSANGRSFEQALSADGRYLYVIGQQDTAAGTVADDTIHVLPIAADGTAQPEIETDNLGTFLPDAPPLTRWQGVVAF